MHSSLWIIRNEWTDFAENTEKESSSASLSELSAYLYKGFPSGI